MTTGSILVIVSLIMIVGLVLLRPFLMPKSKQAMLSERQFLEAEKEALLARIRAIDFDMETGKQHIDDHAAEREFLMDRATNVLQRLDETQDVDALIEATVRRLIEAELAAGQNIAEGEDDEKTTA